MLIWEILVEAGLRGIPFTEDECVDMGYLAS